MKKILIILFTSLAISCTYVEKNAIKRAEAYKINKEVIEKTYNVKVEEKKVGFYIKSSVWHFKTEAEGKSFEVIIDKNGNVLKNEIAY